VLTYRKRKLLSIPENGSNQPVDSQDSQDENAADNEFDTHPDIRIHFRRLHSDGGNQEEHESVTVKDIGYGIFQQDNGIDEQAYEEEFGRFMPHNGLQAIDKHSDQDDAEDSRKSPDQDAGCLFYVLMGYEEEDHNHKGRPNGKDQAGHDDFEDDDKSHQQEPEDEASFRKYFSHQFTSSRHISFFL